MTPPLNFLLALLLVGGMGVSSAAVLVRPGTEDLPGQTILWHNTLLDSLADSEGDPIDNTFVVELGMFSGDFEPLESNLGDWSSNWVVFDQADYDPLLGYFTGEARLLHDGSSDSAEMTPGAASFANEMAYFWIRKGDDPVPNSEWLLFRDESWVFPEAGTECCGNGLPLEWATSDLDSGDVPEYGRQGGAQGPGVFTSVNGDFQTYTFLEAVPEPSTAGLLAIAGVALLRRRRA